MKRHTVTLALAAAASVLTAGAALADSNASSSPQRFTFSGKTVGGNDLPITVSATGPISGKGTVHISERPKTSSATFQFSNGNLQVLFVHGRTSAHPDLAKCRAAINSRGTYTIHGGSGMYAHAAGKGTYTETRLLIGARSTTGKCLSGPNSTPKTITAVATMHGTINLP
jgi:hypothetical protein